MREEREIENRIDRIPLGEGVYHEYDLDKPYGNNCLVVGSTGSGKTVSLTIPWLLHASNHSLIVPVVKPEIIEQMRPCLEDKGYFVQVMDLVHPERGDVGMDLLQYVKSSDDSMEMARAMCSVVLPNWGCHDDPYWEESTISVIAAEIAAVMEAWELKRERSRGYVARPRFEDVLRLHDKIKFKYSGSDGFTTSSVEKAFEDLHSLDSTSYACTCWHTVKGLAPKTLSCIMSMVNTIYSHLFTPEIRQFMNMKLRTYFSNAAEMKMVLFIVTSPIKESVRMFENLLYAQAFKELLEFADEQPNDRLPIPIHIIYDDFACGCRIGRFDRYMSIMRSCGLSVTLVIQSESQMSTLYGYASQSIIDNCSNIVFLGGSSVSSAKDMALRMNAPAQAMMSLQQGEMYILQNGRRPVKTKRYPTFEDPEYIKSINEYEKRKAMREKGETVDDDC